MDVIKALETAGVKLDTPRSLTYEEYNKAIQVAIPHQPDEPCTCLGCGACTGKVHGCTCDIDWDLAAEIRDLWYK
jgi:hypothetical protein